MAKQDSKLISVPLGGQGWGVVGTVAEPPRRLKSQGFPLNTALLCREGKRGKRYSDQPKRRSKLKHDVALGDSSQSM